MSERLEILSDDDAGALARSFDSLPDNQKQWALPRMQAYAAYREQNPLPMSAVERDAYDANERTAYGLYTKYDETLEAMGEGAKPWREFYQKTPNEQKRPFLVKSANTFFARHITRTNFPQEEWPVYRSKIASSLFSGKGASSDEDFYNASAEYLKKREDKRVLISGMGDDRLGKPVQSGAYPDIVNFFTTLPANKSVPENLEEVKKSREDSLYWTAYSSATDEWDSLKAADPAEGGQMMHYDMVKGFRKWWEKAKGRPGYDPADENEHFEMFSRVYEKAQSDTEAAFAVTQKTFPIIARAGDAGGTTLRDVLPMLRGLTDEQKAIWWQQINEMGKEQDSSATGIEGTNQTLAALFRATGNIAKDLEEGTAKESLRGMKFKEGDEVAAQYAGDPKALVNFVSARRMMGGIEVPLNMTGVKITKEQAEAYNKEVEAKQSDLETLYTLREIAQGTLNPLDKGSIPKMAWLATMESVPTMLAVWSRVGAVATYGSYKYQAENELRREGWSREDAATASPFMAVAQTGLDFAGFEFLKKVPLIGGFINKYVSSAPVRAVMRAGTTTAAEMGVEIGQDYLVKGVTKDFAHVMNSVIPGEDWGKVGAAIVKAAPELMVSMMFLSAAGAGVATLAEIKGVDTLMQDSAAMRLLGLKPDAIRDIISAPKDVARTMFMDAFKARTPINEGDAKALTPNGAAEYAAQKRKEWDAMSRDQQNGMLAKAWNMELVPGENGQPSRWVATNGSTGETVTAESKEELETQTREEYEASFDTAMSDFAVNSLTEEEQFRDEWTQDNADAGLKRMFRENGRWYLEDEAGKIIPAGSLANAWKMRDSMAAVNLAKQAEKSKPVAVPDENEEIQATPEQTGEVARAPGEPAATPAPQTGETGRVTEPEVDLFGEPIATEPDTTSAIESPSLATQEVPVVDISLSKDVPNFKAGASLDTGEIEPLGGSFDRRGVGPIILWRRKGTGRLEVISGRHRFGLAKRSGETTIPAQIIDEDAEHDVNWARALDAELNIRDGQGSITDYAAYFRYAGLSEAEATERGLISRSKGRAGFTIGNSAGESVFTLLQNGKLSEPAAEALARTAPGNDALQRVGAENILAGRSIGESVNLMRAMQSAGATDSAEQLDLFGQDDSAMQQARMQGKKADAIQRGLREQRSSVAGAAKRPEVARKLGVDVADLEGVKRKIAEIDAELARWENWPVHPDLVARTREAPQVAPASPAPSIALETQTDADITAERERAEAVRKTAAQKQALLDKAAAPLTGKEPDQTGQGALFESDADLFSGPSAESQASAPSAPSAPTYGASNTIVSLARREAMRQRFKNSLGGTQMNLTPRQLLDAVELAVFHIEAQIRDKAHKFSEWMKAMKEDLGEAVSDADLRDIYGRARGYFTDEDLAAGTPTPAAVEPEQTVEGIPSPLSIQNAHTDRVRQVIGMDPRIPPTRVGLQVRYDAATEEFQSNPNVGRELVEDLRDSGRPATADEMAILNIELAIRVARHSAARKALNEATDSNRNARQLELEAAKLEVADSIFSSVETGTAQGRALQARQGSVMEDYSYGGIVQIIKEGKKNGEALTQAELDYADDAATKVAAAQERVTKAEDEKMASAAADLIAAFREALTFKEEVAENEKLKKAGVESWKDRLKQIADAEREKREKRRASKRGQLGAGFQILDPSDIISYAKEWSVRIVDGAVTLAQFTKDFVQQYGPQAREHAADVFETAKAYLDRVAAGWRMRAGKGAASKQTPEAVREAIRLAAEDSAETMPSQQEVVDMVRSVASEDLTKAEPAVMQEVTDFLAEFYPDLTIRDTRRILTDYGNQTFPSKDKVSKRVRELKQLASIQETIDRMVQDKLRGLKKGYQRDKVTQEIRFLQQQATDLQRRLGFSAKTSEEQLASSLDAAKTRISNEQQDLTTYIDQGGRTKEQMARGEPIRPDAELAALIEYRDTLREVLRLTEDERGLTEEEQAAQILKGLTAIENGLERQIISGAYIDSRNKPAPYTNDEIEAKRSYIATMREEVRRNTEEAYPGKPPAEMALDRAEASLRYYTGIMNGTVTPRENSRQGALSQAEEDIRLQIAAIQQALSQEKRDAKQESGESKRLTALEKRIERLRGILDGSIVPEGRAGRVSLSEREDALLAEIQDYREAIRQSRRADPYIAEERNLVAALRRSTELYQAQLAGGDLGLQPRDRRQTVDTGPVSAAREQMEIARLALADYRRTRQVEIDIARGMARTQAAIERAQQAIREGRFPDRPKRREMATDDALDNLKWELLQAQQEVNAGIHARQLAERTGMEKAGSNLMKTWRLFGILPLLHDAGMLARQAAGLSAHPLILGRAFVKGYLPALFSDAAYQRLRLELEADPLYRNGTYKKNGLALSKFNATSLAEMEETYQSEWIANIPLVRQFSRSQEVFINQARIAVFQLMTGRLKFHTKGNMKSVGNYITVATGKAAVPEKTRQFMAGMSNIFLAPSWMVSRAQYAGMSLQFSTKEGMTPDLKTRAWILADQVMALGMSTGIVMGVMALRGLNPFGGGKDDDDDRVTWNPKSTQFAKLQFGKTYMDFFGGLSQYVTFFSRLVTKESISRDGDTVLLDWRRAYGAPGESDTVGRFLRSKLNMNIGRFWNLYSGSDVTGRPSNWMTELEALSPLAVRDMLAIYKENGVAEATAMSLLVFMGVGVQVYRSVSTENLSAEQENWLNANQMGLPLLRTEGVEGAQKMTTALGLDRKKNPAIFKKYDGQFVTEKQRDAILKASADNVDGLVNTMRKMKAEGVTIDPRKFYEAVKSARMMEFRKIEGLIK